MEPTVVEIHEHIITTANLFFGGLALVLLAAIIPFLILCFKRGQTEIWGKGYDTVSSYCANRRKFGFRFLMFTSTSVGWLTAALLIDEYNSRPDFDARIWVEISSSLLFPLVGFFYTEGNGINKTLDCGGGRVPIAISMALHYIGALYFMLANAIVNLTYAIDIQGDSNNERAMFALSIISLASIAIFLAAQCVLNFKCAKNCIKNFNCTNCCTNCGGPKYRDNFEQDLLFTSKNENEVIVKVSDNISIHLTCNRTDEIRGTGFIHIETKPATVGEAQANEEGATVGEVQANEEGAAVVRRRPTSDSTVKKGNSSTAGSEGLEMNKVNRGDVAEGDAGQEGDPAAAPQIKQIELDELPTRLSTPDCVVEKNILCAVSFISEFMAFISVAVLTALASLKRNNNVTWFK